MSDDGRDRSAVRPRPLGEAPARLVEDRTRLQEVVTQVITPARYRATGRIGLRSTPDGFGTPRFEVDGTATQVRVSGSSIVVERGDEARTEPLTTLGAAAEFVLGQPRGDLTWASDLDVGLADPRPPDHDVAVDPEVAAFLGDWFALAFAVLEQLRDDPRSVEASDPQLWPEHFDAAIEVLPAPRRASYGFSPGDDDHALPYAYVAPWSPADAGITLGDPPWDATGFGGAELSFDDLRSADDQAGRVLEWFRHRRDLLAG